ncbi:putative amidase NDAI_0C05110 [Naumovozyma dairenensis CBS 421]|uniref:amidase n=1 Tax=Naumovozyma dairenensis (strain ATCC 10597 / BCRC 20456 / CBS 421 / NBRC 0211 / NRRL Y-12639) TaxID=1071378 RepID=G0W8Q9_NAUDC|nr:hypothetical protein NDAI_0C05110 [Naumovozyma dairenensis CBS 421]CCD24170.1 hypothetical protein NDAI_0C05110 [Naumovozyma dairenensis CBS 421]
MSATWEDIVKEKRSQLYNKIPKEWRFDEKILNRLKADKTSLSKNLDLVCPELENEITHSTILKLKEKISSNTLTCYQVSYAFCHRAALIHQVLNCLSEIMFQNALEYAKNLDINKSKISELPPLYGIPISLKDQCNVVGVDTTLGYVSRAMKPKELNDESLIVTLLESLGAVTYAKTTVPPSMMATETNSNLFGYTLNGLNQNFSTGGSSGGEGALISCSGSLLGLGTDIGGSIRIPSSYHGLFGLKPSTGKIPYLKVDNSFEGREIIPSVIGPLAKDLDDLRYFLEVIVNHCKPWKYDVNCSPYEFSHYKDYELRKEKGKPFIVGIWYGDGVITLPPSDLRALKYCKEVIDQALIAGEHIRTMEWDPPVELNKELHDLAMEADIADAGNEISLEFSKSGEPTIDILKPMVEITNSHTYSVNQWWDLSRRCYITKQKFREYYNSLAEDQRPDVIIAPTTLTAFRPGDMMKTSLRYILFVNVLNFPSLSIPVGNVDLMKDQKMDVTTALNPEDEMVIQYWNSLVDSGEVENFPIGLQIISPIFQDDNVCRFGSWLMHKIDKK